MIRKKLQLETITSKKTPFLKERDARSSKDLVTTKKIFKVEEIGCEIKYVNLEENDTTIEIFKQVLLLLELNKEISIIVEDPEDLLQKHEEKLLEEKRLQDEKDSPTGNKKDINLSIQPNVVVPIDSKGEAKANESQRNALVAAN